MEVADLGDRIDAEHKKFCNNYWASAVTRATWRPMWENWMIRAVEEFAPKQQKGSLSHGRTYESPGERKEREWMESIASIYGTGSPAGDHRGTTEHEPPAVPARTPQTRIISLDGRRVG
jgi:hypothetical protein